MPGTYVERGRERGRGEVVRGVGRGRGRGRGEVVRGVGRCGIEGDCGGA